MTTAPAPNRAHRSAPIRLLAGVAAAAAALGLTPVAAASPSTGGTPRVTRTSYTNPVSRDFADTFADPSVIRGVDGSWYAYGTSDPLREGEGTPHRIPIAKSDDLVSWHYVQDAFTAATVPTWADTGQADPANRASLWAPDIRYVDGQYRMYYVVTQTTVTSELGDNAIGMATAPTPVGPWTDSGAPVVGPRRGAGASGDFLWTFDPSAVTDSDGRSWLFYGSYYGGIYATRLSADGRHPVGKATQVAIDNKFEGAYPVHHGGYWYLFASTANCCAGPTTGYSVQVGRARSVNGPYRDQQGVSLTASRAGGTPTLVQNGNSFVGVGHNAVATDLAGQDWIVYHGIDRADPYLDGTDGINQRPMLIDRLDWVHGWPAVRAGRGPSDTERRGPATGGRFATDFTGGVPSTFATTGRWAAGTDAQSGALVRSRGAATLTARGAAAPRLRVQADVRSRDASAGLRARVGTSTVRATLDPRRRRLTVTQTRDGRTLRSASEPLPARVTRGWHATALEISGGHAVATVSADQVGDPLAQVDVTLAGGGRVDRGGVFARAAGVDVDDVSVLPAARRVSALVRDVVPSRLDASESDSFNGTALRPGWSWVRPDAAAKVSGGRLVWPTEKADLGGSANDAGVLLRDAPQGAWTIQTKVSIDLGTTAVHNYNQGGLVAYVTDDQFARLSVVSIWNTRQTEFGHETPYAGRLAYGGTIVGPPAATTWLRLTHRVDPQNGEHELRAWSSRDGRTWVKGGVWTLPAGTKLRVGLVSHGAQSDVQATSRFDYFRLYR